MCSRCKNSIAVLVLSNLINGLTMLWKCSLNCFLGCNQWGRKLEGWLNTAARLADWRRVYQQVRFCTRWTGRTACLFLTVPVSPTGAAQLRADGISSCCDTVNVHNHPSRATWRQARKAWSSTLVAPCFLSGCNFPWGVSSFGGRSRGASSPKSWPQEKL
jgi:hypothetical protein